MVLAAQVDNDNTVFQGSMAHSNNCGGYKQQLGCYIPWWRGAGTPGDYSSTDIRQSDSFT